MPYLDHNDRFTFSQSQVKARGSIWNSSEKNNTALTHVIWRLPGRILIATFPIEDMLWPVIGWIGKGRFDQIKALLSSLELDKKSIVLISINNNDSVEAEGSH